MKIVFGLVLVLVALVGMVFAFAWADGEFGDSMREGVRVNADGPMTGVEKTYLEYMIVYLDMTATEVSNLSALIGTPVLDNQAWQDAAHITLDRIRAAHSSASGMEPTGRLQPFHQSSLETFSRAARFADIMEATLDQGSSDVTEEAAQELAALSEGFVETERLLNEFLEAHPVPPELIPPAAESSPEEAAGAAGG